MATTVTIKKEANSALTLRNGSKLGRAPLQDLSAAQARSPTTPSPRVSSSASAQCPTLTMAASSLWVDSARTRPSAEEIDVSRACMTLELCLLAMLRLRGRVSHRRLWINASGVSGGQRLTGRQRRALCQRLGAQPFGTIKKAYAEHTSIPGVHLLRWCVSKMQKKTLLLSHA